jgi:2-polyprenyl-3-methyl-5-hydroxy-6-metoxy-1,4-benzoquinol methylase
MASLLLYIADECGVFSAMDANGPLDAQTLASKCGVDPRYLRELLLGLAAQNYIDFDESNDVFSLSPEQTAVFAREGEATSMLGIFQIIVAQFAEFESAVEEFKSGNGRPWGSHHACQFCGTNRFFRPGYVAKLISEWIPALDGVEAKLQAGAQIADVGCGLGASSALLAQQYPDSQVYGFDLHDGSIEQARNDAAELNLSNLQFECAEAGNIPAHDGYDLICIFDALHDMGDPVGVARYLRGCLKPGGTLMVVEPLAGDKPSDNMHVLGGLFYAASTLVCLPNSRSQNVGLCLGAQAGPARLQQVLTEAGFSSVGIATTSATNIVLEARQ